MRTAIVGGGPGGLYLSILLKKLDPTHDVTVYERNAPDDTFGFGVVFSDETLTAFEAADADSYAEITRRFARWAEIDVHYRGEVVTSGGHGFSALARVDLLGVLQRRAAALDGDLQVHGYPFGDAMSTFIVETTPEAWRGLGLDRATEEESLAICENLFSDVLEGHRLIANRSLWIDFVTVRNASWRHENVVLLGDAAHTAHFSIGSGTKLAMEDAIALAWAFREHGPDDVPGALEAYEAERRPIVESTQRAAQGSLEWFEGIGRYMGQDPRIFAFNLLTRSRRITYTELQLRDPGFIASVDAAFSSRPPMFTPFRLRGMELCNRVVVSPMDMYCSVDGTPGDFHLVHLGHRGIGGAGLVMTEMICVSREGRITPGCGGLYRDEHTAAWKRIVAFVHAHGRAKIGCQLGHSGRQGSTTLMWEAEDQPLDDGNWPLIAPSPLPYLPGISQVPREMTRADMDAVRDDFVAATRRAAEAGFDLLEIHMAHGYLLSSFLSPLTNVRDDEYGGALGNRARLPPPGFPPRRA